GHDTLWQPGTDHAGIATQMVVERELTANQQPSRREMGREAFLARVWQQKVKSRGNIIGQLKRLGASCDWSREAFTMGGAHGDPDAGKGAPNFHDAVIKVFVDMYQKGLIYRGKRLVNWDPHFETAISDLEVENIDVAGHMWHFKYPLAGGATYEYVEKDEDGNVTLRETRDYISIATTRPETMLGDGAVAVHPSDERYAPIVGQLCEIPVGPKEHRRLIPIITDDYPDPDFGSGAVKITGAHDFNDYAVARRGNIPCYRLMDTKGHMRQDGAPYAQDATIAMAVARGQRELTESETDAINLVPDDLRGLDRFEARKRVVAQITAEGLAVMMPNPGHDPDREADPDRKVGSLPTIPFVEAKPIMQPFGDRSKVVIEPMLTDQWFVDAEKIIGPALDAVRGGDITILPESGEKTYYHWLENIEPWCISRQLWWGHQVPVWYGPGVTSDNHIDYSTGAEKAFCGASWAEVAELAKAYYGVAEVHEKADFSGALEDQLESFSHNERSISLHRDPDVLDTWFSSGLWPIGTLGWPEQTPELARYFPTSTLVTGQDILFFWVARMIMMQLSVVDQIPFDTVYLHGLVRDAKGKKMSKSTGNVIDPLDIIDQYGADALRFSSAAMAALGGVLKLDMERIKGYRNFGTKLWNAVRFAEMNGVYEAHKGPTEVRQKSDTLQTANKWIVGETARARELVDEAMQAFRFNDAANGLYAFVWGKVCDWYVEFAKPLLGSEDPDIVAETRATMNWVMDQCLILLHPIMPFITEELWQATTSREKMLIHADWPTFQATDLVDEKADTEMNWVISLIEGIRSARAQMRVPDGLHVAMLHTDLDAAGRAAWASNATLIKRLARVESLSKINEMPKGTITIAVEGGSFGMPLADIIDATAEQARLEKALVKLGKELGGLKGRLSNEKFIASAPEEVVEETRANAAIKEEEAGKLRAALARLAEVA
ncbi:MAG: valine--tRNA ligase, partial [Rhodobacteraceae bacterium]|nr:valine--tRNA ligase [Paracoccaceae bacterium]